MQSRKKTERLNSQPEQKRQSFQLEQKRIIKRPKKKGKKLKIVVQKKNFQQTNNDKTPSAYVPGEDSSPLINWTPSGEPSRNQSMESSKII